MKVDQAHSIRFAHGAGPWQALNKVMSDSKSSRLVDYFVYLLFDFNRLIQW